MEIKQIEFDDLVKQQAVFGPQDHLAKSIEKFFSVSIVARGSSVEITGETGKNVELAESVLNSLMELYDKGDELTKGTVHRLMEEAYAGSLDETVRAMDSVVILNNRGVPVKCKTPGQQRYVQALRESTVTLCIGPAGTGKTYLAIAQAAKELRDGEIDRIIMSRPAIEAGEERLGFLPGDLAQKVDPYLRPLYDALNDIMGMEKAEKLRERGIIEIAPLAYMRGRTLSRSRVIIDESQNASLMTLKMALTRLGEGSKMVLTGDVTQIDLPHASDSGLQKCAEILQPIEGISVTKLSNRDVVRNKIVRDIVKAFEKEEQRREEKEKAFSRKKRLYK
ncbi:MAG TPA: PhoH family protein [Candidatus Egerieimonas intestinavium]|uniref:PhoH-like protein n=1 Tax=Candidatus Egerieimonas intestinavium TaxID=2840777 RepID=A0A9D1ELX9_9FIRM|nr:PhoH family protein [Candidatus Egerieimonas intestinavium]